MGEQIAAWVGAGGATVLALVVGYLLNANRQDRRDYREAVDRAEARADAAEERARGRLAQVEEQRRARYAAEEEAARLRGEQAGRSGGGRAP